MEGCVWKLSPGARKVWEPCLCPLLPEHAGGNRTEGGGPVAAVRAQWEPAVGGQGSYEGRGRAAGGEAEAAQREPLGAAEGPAWQTTQHAGEHCAISPRASLSVAEERDCWRLKLTHVCTWLSLNTSAGLSVYVPPLVCVSGDAVSTDWSQRSGGAVLLRQICFSFGFFLEICSHSDLRLRQVTFDGQFSFTLLEFFGHCLPGLPLNFVLISASVCPYILGFSFPFLF